MELKISCDASVKLKKMNGIKTVDCTVSDYEIDKDTLTGNMKIAGKYIKDNLEEEYEFTELVPFTVVFRDENFSLNNIRCQNFTFNQIVNQGLECHFDILIDYTKRGVEEDPEDSEVELDFFQEPQIDDNLIKDADELEEDEQISEKYDEMLKDILTKRNDNFLEGNEDVSISEERIADIEGTEFPEEQVVEDPVAIEVEVKKANSINIKANLDKKETISPFSKTLQEKYDNYKVYFIKTESEVDRICQLEKVNMSEVLEDFVKNNRIIIK